MVKISTFSMASLSLLHVFQLIHMFKQVDGYLKPAASDPPPVRLQQQGAGSSFSKHYHKQ